MTAHLRRRRGLRSAVVGNMLVLGGSVPTVRLHGKAATTSVPALLGALDGRRDVRELSEAVGAPDHHVELMLSLLGRYGAVESAGAVPESCSLEAGFFAVVAGHRGDPRSGEELGVAFAGTTVEVLGENAFAVKVRAAVDTRERRQPSGGTLVVGTAMEELIGRWRTGATVLPVRAAGNELAIGPVTRLGSNPCPCCLTEGTYEPTALAGRYEDLAAAFIAARIPVLATVGHDDLTWSQAQHVDFESGRTRFVSRASRPGCPDCSVLGGIATRPASAAARYEAALGTVAPAPRTNPSPVEWPLARRVPAVGIAAQVQRAWAGNAVASLRCHLLLPAGADTCRGGFGVVRDVPDLAVLSTGTSSGPAMVVLTGLLDVATRWSGDAALHELLLEAGWAIEVLREALAGRGKVLDAWSDERLAWLPTRAPEREPVLAVLEIEEA